MPIMGIIELISKTIKHIGKVLLCRLAGFVSDGISVLDKGRSNTVSSSLVHFPLFKFILSGMLHKCLS